MMDLGWFIFALTLLISLFYIAIADMETARVSAPVAGIKANSNTANHQPIYNYANKLL